MKVRDQAMHSHSPIRLKFPRQDQAGLTRFRADPTAAGEWAAQLPVANTRTNAMELLAALSELNHHALKPELRFEIVDALSDNLRVTLANLSQRFLRQPLVMSEGARQLAELTDSLYGQLITAYSLVAVETIRDHDSIRDTNPARLVCSSIQRALDFSGRSMLLTFQLYRPVVLGGWLTMHQLYKLAERQGLTTLPVTDIDGDSTDICATYLRTLIMGCSKPNQLRQTDLAAVYKALGEWSDKLQVTAAHCNGGLFLVDLESDQPPLYSALYGNNFDSQHRHIHTGTLVSLIQQLNQQDQAQGKPGVSLADGTRVPSNLLSHLLGALGGISMRNFKRAGTRESLSVCLGLSGAHYQAAGGRSFRQLIHGDDYRPPAEERVAGNRFLEESRRRGGDAWSSANPQEDYLREPPAGAAEEALRHQIDLDTPSRETIADAGADPGERNYVTHQVQMRNVSPGGYCVEWDSELPEEIWAGNLLSVKEAGSNSWALAVVRWLSRPQGAKTLVGLELVSPRAEAYAALVQQKTGGETEPQRVLLLPEIQLVGQPHTLITPRAGFRERQKVSLLRAGEKHFIQLTREVTATASYAQFDFRYIKELREVLAEDKSAPLDDAYDSMWSKL